jgi:3-deoxy-D-manno-octulosonic-acid transferase
MENFREMSGKFLAAGAAIQINSSEELGAAWADLLREPERAARLGACARKLVELNRGATQRVLEHIEQVIGHDRSAS